MSPFFGFSFWDSVRDTTVEREALRFLDVLEWTDKTDECRLALSFHASFASSPSTE